jgi:hypothetical protein
MSFARIGRARIAGISSAALLLCCGAASAAGPLRAFQLGLWSGGAYTDDRTGRFSHCSAGVAYDNGINLFVVSTEAHGWWLGFWNPQWSLSPNASVPIKLRFDGQPPVDVPGTVTNAQTLLVPIPDDSRLTDRFQRSSQLTMTAQGRPFALSLGSTSAVLAELAKCVRSSVALETHAPPSPSAQATPPSSPLDTGAPPSSSGQPAPHSDPLDTGAPSSPIAPPPSASLSRPEAARPTRAKYATELEEIRLARNFLLAANLPNARLIDANKPTALAKFSAVWRSDNAAGAVRIVPPGRDVTGLAIASDLIAVDPQLCKWNFASARASEAVDGSPLFRALLSCSEGHGERTAQYFITPWQNGGFVVFAVIGNSVADGGFTADGQKADMLKRAAVRAAGPGD